MSNFVLLYRYGLIMAEELTVTEMSNKKGRGDRKDGILLKNLDAMHYIMPLIYPNRCDNEAFISERIDLTNINA